MNLNTNIKSIKLICKTPMVAHWGEILIIGEEYTGNVVTRNTEIITDYVNYWKHKEIRKSFTKRIDMPFIDVKCSDGRNNSFCLLSDSELFALGADRRSSNKPCFSYSVFQVDDYFDYTKTRRDNVLNKLGL